MDAPRYCYRHPDRETGLSCSECGRPICYECMTTAPVGLRCPEHSGKPQGIQKVAQGAQRTFTGVGSHRGNVVTLTLIAINVAVVFAEFASSRSASFTNNSIFTHGSLFASLSYNQFSAPVGVAHGEYWRLVTAMFLHVSFLHIAFNMYALYWAGSILEQLIGRWRFLLLYLASGIAGSAGALLWSPNVPSAGASGAIFGVLGALFVLERRGNISTGGQIAALIVINLVITFALSTYISVGAHVGGLFAGIVLMVLLTNFRRSWIYSVASALGVIVVAFVIAYAKARNYG
jgi:membrane associated rhomboid family serine protease